MKRDAPVAAPSVAFFAAQSQAARASGQNFATLAAQALGLSTADTLLACGEVSALRVFDADRLHALAPAFDLLSFADAERRQLVLAREGEQTWVVVDDPFDAGRIDWIEHRLGQPFRIALATAEEIHAWLKRHETSQRATEGALSGVGAGHPDATRDLSQDLSLGGIAAESSPVVRLVSSMIFDALKASASDLHLESDPEGMAIKVRVDGVLDAAGRIDGRATAEQVVSRIKVLAELDIAERRVPQDGRFQVRLDGRDIDLRVSVMPAVHGEDAVIRILDRQRLADDMRGLTFETLGFDQHTITQLRELARLPYGLLLVTGPTGSGKTTTLYAALTEINHGDEKIVTIEDPVEYQLNGIVQIPVNEKRGLTFSRGLRSVLRHDPDKIMVGEIRDSETGQIAVQAALTGHLVFTTVHANSVFDVIGRMLHIGVDPFNLTAALNAIVAQRLVRINCTHCCHDVTVDLSGRPAHERERLSGLTLRAGRGCGACRGTGYRGRRAVAEILLLDDELRDLIAQRAPLSDVKAAARRRGLRSIRAAALELVALGQTTLTELDRVTFADPDGPVPST
ncbi:MAG: GspE/PulE family protein [Rhizobacter sp.]